MFSHWDQCCELIVGNKLGVVVQHNNGTSITWFQWTVTDEGMSTCQHYSSDYTFFKCLSLTILNHPKKSFEKNLDHNFLLQQPKLNIFDCKNSRLLGARWPSGLKRWLALATGRCETGSNPTTDNFASELWQFRLSCFASVFRRRH